MQADKAGAHDEEKGSSFWVAGLGILADRLQYPVQLFRG